MPLAFCCTLCFLYDSENKCTKAEITPSTSAPSVESKIKLISASISGEQLKVIVEQEGKEFPIYIDLRKHLKSI